MPIFKQNTEIKSIKKGTQDIKEVYRGTTLVWSGFTPMVATGGSISDVNINGVNYRIHAFTSTGTSTFTVSDVGTFGTVDALIVAGGAGGTLHNAGGGGAGGVIFETNKNISNQSYNITVGNGGVRDTDDSVGINGTSGENSSALGITSIGGGRGGSWDIEPALDGGSGGGQGCYSNGSIFSPGDGIDGQGNRGGFSINSGDNRAGGGGGGAGQVGGNAVSNTRGGNGGNGIDLSLYFPNWGTNSSNTTTGTRGWFGGGGGGVHRNANENISGLGGIGGGGFGRGAGSSSNAQDGQTNTGGGGGSKENPGLPGNGGSGIVLIRYRLDPPS